MAAKKHSVFNRALENSLVLYLAPLLILSVVMFVLILSGHDFSSYSYYIIHYIYTYRHGYISRGFVGEVISWFVDIVTPQVTAVAVIIGSFLLIIAASLCIGFALNKVKKDKKLFWLVFWMIVILCLSPFTFRNYLTAVKLDKFIWALTLFTIPMITGKKTIWFVPPMCVLAIVVNPIFLFTSMVAIAIPLLQKLHDENFSRKMIIICVLTYSLLIIAGLASAISEKFVGFENAEEMVRYYFSRYRDPSGDPVITDEMLKAYSENLLVDYFVPVKELLPTTFKTNLTDSGSMRTIIFNVIFFVTPAYVLIIAFWRCCIKKSKDLFQKIIFLACILSPLLALLPCILSWEISKYFSNNVFAQTCIAIYFIVSKNEPVLAAVDTVKAKVKENRIIVAIVISYLTLLMIH